MLAARGDQPACSASDDQLARFHSQILDTLGQAVIVTSPTGMILSWNRFAERLYGWSKAEAVGKSLAILVPNEALEHAEAIITFLKAGEPWSGEFRMRRRDGSTFVAEITNMPLVSDGEVQAIVGVSQDISQRKRVESALRQSEQHFRGLIEQAPYGIQVFGPNGKTIHVNPAWEKLWGMTLDQVRNFNILQDRQLRAQGILPLLRRGFAGETVYIPEIFYDVKESAAPNRPDAIVRRWGSAVVYPLRDTHGRVQEIAVLYQDITARKKAEDALKESERLHRAIGESIDYGVWICDHQGRNVYVSQSFLRLTGLTQAECSGTGWSKALHPDDLPATMQAWQECVERGLPWDRELRVRSADGGWHPLLSRGVPVRNDRGEVTAWAGINLDISRLKTVEHELRMSDSRKDQFLATLAHELRNPLAPICTALEVLKTPGIESTTIEQLISTMQRQLDQLTLLVDDLLDVSRMTRGRIELNKEPVDVASLLAHVIETVQPLIETQRQQLRIDLPAEPLRLSADRARLTQIIGNVLINAAKYTEAGGHIWIAAQRREHQAIFAIRDDGIGISPEMLPHIFEPFVQADVSLHRSRGGLGIGLSLVKNLVEMHDGTVAVHSPGLGQGTEVTITLPIGADWIEEKPEPPRRQQSTPSKSKRVLLVDDNQDAANSMALLLRLHGHDVYVAYDGATALKAAADHRPEVIFIDIGMPIIDGYRLAELLREQPELEESMLVALTGWGQDADRVRSTDAGFDHHLVKPVELQSLLNLLSNSD